MFMVCVNVVGIIFMSRVASPHPAGGTAPAEEARLRGEDFFALARYASTAMMPSVALLCEEMASQRRWVFDASKDAQAGTKARADVVLGKLDRKALEAMELDNQEELESVNSASWSYFTVQFLIKVLIGNVLPLWLQASFFQLSFTQAGFEARCKIIAGIATSALLVLVRSMVGSGTISKLGCLGFIFAALDAIISAWAAAKVYYAFKCKDHIWNLSTGCVDITS
mmetsp:Transcript_21662/g.44426  ORF Transcript_21662/g.44426 Transcript_21662/m.44426 type:complete len:225 (-) Transcript_21662:6-680(-)